MWGGLALAIDDREDNGDELMLRPAAARHLTRKLGRPVTIHNLKWWARTNQGPPFAVVLRKATYSKADMDAWVAEQLRKK